MKPTTLLEESPVPPQRSGWIVQAREMAARPCQAQHCPPAHLLHLALNEAEALAWQSGFPQLFFHALAAEKIAALRQWAQRQERIRERRRSWSLAA